jgi:hypothetical protein
MDSSAEKLDKTAAMIDRGETLDQQTADLALANAAHAMASYDYAVAQDSMKSNDRARFGEHLSASAHDLELAAKWTGHETERGVTPRVAPSRFRQDHRGSRRD